MLEDTPAASAAPAPGITAFCSSALASLAGAMRSFQSRPAHPSAADHQHVDKIRRFSATLTRLSDEQLRQRVAELRMGSLSDGNDVFEPRVVPTFSLVNEAARRTLGMRYFDVQLLAGLVLARQSVAEMQTGEGKTLVAALPAVLFSLVGRGVHVMTASAYLAQRDAALLHPLFKILGITVGHLDSQASLEEKRVAYSQDVTYGPAYEFAFDYLRDQAALLAAGERPMDTRFRRLLYEDDLREYQPRQRSRAYAIVDEIDSILVDEANSPLILSEQLPITAEQQPLAGISRQRYVGLYQGMCGMSGTTNGVESEFWEYYRLPVVHIPLRKTSQRTLLPTRFFGHESAKWEALVEEVRRLHRSGQPLLVGTRTMTKSQLLAERFDAENIPSRLLKGVQDADEATLIAEAGRRGAVTIATNMAGRGTDIKLGPGVAALGGLHVVVAEPHESTRVDRQLLGRAARQGDPGSCQMFVSADDQLIKDHGTQLRDRLRKLADERGQVNVDMTQELLRLQARVERQSFAKRRRMFAQDCWLDEVLVRRANEN